MKTLDGQALAKSRVHSSLQLDMVPAHWEVRRLRTVLQGVTERDRPELPLLSVVREQGVILRDLSGQSQNRNFVPDDLSNYKVVREGQFAINKMKAWQGSYGVSEHDGIVSPAYHVYSVEDVTGDYFHVAIRSRAYVPQFAAASDGVRVGQWDLSPSRMRQIPFLIPSKPEQVAIVRFLRHVEERIRRYIRAKERLTELLEEQKQAIIHQAVTGQIDVRTGKPYAAYTDSGVEWLGEVPEHWSVRRNRWLFRERNETGFGSLPILEVSLRDGVRIRDIKSGQRKQQIVDRDRYKRAKEHDVAYNTMRMWQGAVGAVPVDGLVSPAYVVITPVERMESGYFGYLFRTEAYKNAVKTYSRGIVSDRDRLYWDAFKRIASFVPPLEEQIAIVGFLDDLTGQTDRLVRTTEKLMGWLTEWKESVICHVVTGKLDVRAAAASFPECGPVNANDTLIEDPGADLEAPQTDHPTSQP